MMKVFALLFLCFLSPQNSFAAKDKKTPVASTAKPAAKEVASKAGTSEAAAGAATGAAVTSPLPPAPLDELGLSPEAISAKAILEELITRRYTQGAATFIDRPYFTVGAQLVLAQRPKPTPAPAPEAPKPTPEDDFSLPGDLLLGSLDIEDVTKVKITPEVREEIDHFIRDYLVTSVNVSIGLKSTLGEEVKAKTEAWLKDRTKAEFGTHAVASVTYLSDPVEKKKDNWDKLNQFQNLAGQLALAAALLFGLLLYLIFGGNKKQAPAPEMPAPAPAQIVSPANGTPPPVADAKLALEKAEEEENLKLADEVQEYSRKLTSLVPKISQDSTAIVRSWCEAGSEGMTKLVCFAEAMGGELGRMPVPADFVKPLSEAFSTMHELELKPKRDALVKTYWDLMMVVNLGTETLEKPFSYLGAMKTNLINQVLIDQNSKMKTLVALFMPESLRAQYIAKQDLSTKIDLLKEAQDMSEIDTAELNSYDAKFKSGLGGNQDKNTVPIDSALLKIVNSLSPSEEISLLPQVQGAGVERFKRTYPSLAFLTEWTDVALKQLFSKAMPDEVVAYLRMVPQSQERILKLCPPMTAAVTLEDLARPEEPENERNQQLDLLRSRMKQMVDSQEIALGLIFPDPSDTLNQTHDEEKKAA